MTVTAAAILGFYAYKLGCLAAGSLFAVLGYKLFVAGVVGDAGSLDARHKDTKLTLRDAAPGTFFALFGAVVIVVTLWQGVHYEEGGGGGSPPELPDARGEKNK